jgi:hypothetical protein
MPQEGQVGHWVGAGQADGGDLWSQRDVSSIIHQAQQREAGLQNLTGHVQPPQYPLRWLFVPKWTSQLVD